jgi:phosphoglycerate dehydrogenase-like enzyme
VAGGKNFRLAPSVREGLTSTAIELVELPLREADGSVPPEVGEADILISGAAVIDDPAASGLHNVRLVVRPYVGYDDIDTGALTRKGILSPMCPMPSSKKSRTTPWR